MTLTPPTSDFCSLKITSGNSSTDPFETIPFPSDSSSFFSSNFQSSIRQSVKFKVNAERFNFLGYFIQDSTIKKVAKKIERYIQNLPNAFNEKENSFLHIRCLAEKKGVETALFLRTTSNGNILYNLLSNSPTPLVIQELLFPLIVSIGKKYESHHRLQQLTQTALQCWNDSLKEANTIFSHYKEPLQSDFTHLLLEIGLCEGICTEYLSQRLNNPMSHYTRYSPYELKKSIQLNNTSKLHPFKVDALQKKKARFISAASMIATQLKINEEVEKEVIPEGVLRRNKLQIVDYHPKMENGEEYEYPLSYIAPLIYQIKDSLERSGNLLKLYVVDPSTNHSHAIVVQPYATFHFLEPSIGFVETKNLNKLLILLLAHLRQAYPSYTLCFFKEYTSTPTW